MTSWKMASASSLNGNICMAPDCPLRGVAECCIQRQASCCAAPAALEQPWSNFLAKGVSLTACAAFHQQSLHTGHATQ